MTTRSPAVGGLGDVRVVGGKMVFNLLPAHAPQKGIALIGSRARFQCRVAVYIGDDDTDEDVFGLDDAERVLGIRVEQSADSNAAYFLRDPTEIDAVLELLLSWRPAERFGRKLPAEPVA